jgi:hypothetical protein
LNTLRGCPSYLYRNPDNTGGGNLSEMVAFDRIAAEKISAERLCVFVFQIKDFAVESSLQQKPIVLGNSISVSGKIFGGSFDRQS